MRLCLKDFRYSYTSLCKTHGDKFCARTNTQLIYQHLQTKRPLNLLPCGSGGCVSLSCLRFILNSKLMTVCKSPVIMVRFPLSPNIMSSSSSTLWCCFVMHWAFNKKCSKFSTRNSTFIVVTWDNLSPGDRAFKLWLILCIVSGSLSSPALSQIFSPDILTLFPNHSVFLLQFMQEKWKIIRLQKMYLFFNIVYTQPVRGPNK